MRNGFRLGRISGIHIYIDWSWMLIFLLVAWNLSYLFWSMHPDWSTRLRWTVALCAALLFFVSVLLHELAHSLVALQQKVPVRSITLFLFGGVSNIEREPPSPQAEFLITIVGPITSIVLGLLFTWLGTARMNIPNNSLFSPTEVMSQLDPVSTLLLWLGPINLALGLFNLIPGFPLDGGRILRSILWAITDNLRRATRWATWVGQFVAWLFIVAGIAMVFGLYIPFFGTGLISGLWLAFIGWFLNSAAVQGYRQVVVEDLLEGISVARIMRTQPPTVPAHISLRELVHDHIMGTDDHAFPVVENDHLVGLVTLEDIRKAPREAWDTTQVSEIMTPADQLAVATPEEDAEDALHKLTQRDVRQLPVLRKDGALAGILRRRDIVRWLQLQGAS